MFITLQQLGLSKQGQQAVNKVRNVEKEARQGFLRTSSKNADDNLNEPLLGGRV